MSEVELNETWEILSATKWKPKKAHQWALENKDCYQEDLEKVTGWTLVDLLSALRQLDREERLAAGKVVFSMHPGTDPTATWKI